MKKGLLALVCALLVFSLAACAEQPTEEQKQDFYRFNVLLAGMGAVTDHFDPVIVAASVCEKGTAVLGIPETIFEGQEGYTRGEGAGEVFERTITVDGADSKVGVSVISQKISDVSCQFTTDGYDDGDAALDAVRLKFLVDNFGEPESVTLEGADSTVDEIVSRLEGGAGDLQCGVVWKVAGDGDVEYTYMYQDIVGGTVGLNRLTVF